MTVGAQRTGLLELDTVVIHEITQPLVCVVGHCVWFASCENEILLIRLTTYSVPSNSCFSFRNTMELK